MELADTSAWTNLDKSPEVARDFAERLMRREIATCDAVKIELLRRERDHVGVAARRLDLEALRNVPIGSGVWRRSLDVLELVAERGLHHRGVPLADLLVAAAAESAELAVLHYDRHFELIAAVTGQPVRAIAPLGSL